MTKKYLYVFCENFTNYSFDCSTLEEALNIALYDIQNSGVYPVFILENNKVLYTQIDIAKLYKGSKK